MSKMNLKFLLLTSLSLLLTTLSISAQPSIAPQTADNHNDTIRLKIVEMADLHGNLTKYDFVRQRRAIGGLSYAGQYMLEQRMNVNQETLFLDGGDFLQGSLQTYFYNYIDSREAYMPVELANLVTLDAAVVGNHDLEVGISKLSRFRRSTKFNVLAANIEDRNGGELPFEPYAIFYKRGLKIAILGLSTPVMMDGARVHSPDNLEVVDMLDVARFWVEHIKSVEQPDMILGLFHAGIQSKEPDYYKNTASYSLENDPLYIAEQIPGFDAIFLGHLHKLDVNKIANIKGDSVWLIEPGYGGQDLGVLNFEIVKKSGEKAKILKSSVELIDVYDKYKDYMLEAACELCDREHALIEKAAKEQVAVLKDTICNIESFFGSSFFVDMTHKVQLAYTGAEVSFAAPLSSNVRIAPGPILFSDMFRIYRYDNTLTTIWMTGKEIKNYLEYSYNLWINQMKSPSDRLLRTKANNPKMGAFLGRDFEIPQYYFDSGTGLDYEVDVTKPYGQRIKILRMWSGRKFEDDQFYSVVTNNYRISGAGGHIKLGARIDQDELEFRYIETYDMQIRELLRLDFIKQGEVKAFQYDNWKFVPDSYFKPAEEREIKELRR
jgi:2',3'-cyclic-nucleotide 2'-phosphodiesterase/3'-nucleotidase